MAASEREVSAKGVHCIPKLETAIQNLGKTFKIILRKGSFLIKLQPRSMKLH